MDEAKEPLDDGKREPKTSKKNENGVHISQERLVDQIKALRLPARAMWPAPPPSFSYAYRHVLGIRPDGGVA